MGGNENYFFTAKYKISLISYINQLISFIVVPVLKSTILEDVIKTITNRYDFCLCNPPFFENIEDIKKRRSTAKETLATTAKQDEILAEGGEVTFVKNLIKDSLAYRTQVSLYTSMFGRKKSYLQILKELQSIKDISYTKTEFCQGNTIRWGIAWTYMDSIDLNKVEQPKHKKPKKAKPALLYKIPKDDKKIDTVKKLSKFMQKTFLELEILYKVIKSVENYAEIQITSDKNTWSNQRRKRRQILKEGSEKEENLNCITSTVDANSESGNLSNKNSASLDSHSVPELQLKEASYANNYLESVDKNSHENVSIETHENVSIETHEMYHKKREMDCEDPLGRPLSKKLKTENEKINTESPEVFNCTDSITALKKSESEDSDLGESKFKEKQNDGLVFKPSSLLFCTLKIRKMEDHILLEMNCLPDANRESMHQIFQFLKNKLAFK